MNLFELNALIWFVTITEAIRILPSETSNKINIEMKKNNPDIRKIISIIKMDGQMNIFVEILDNNTLSLSEEYDKKVRNIL